MQDIGEFIEKYQEMMLNNLSNKKTRSQEKQNPKTPKPRRSRRSNFRIDYQRPSQQGGVLENHEINS